jgi:hypothetical protein
LWRAQHPEASIKDEPQEIAEKRQYVMLRLATLREGDTDPWLGRTIHTIIRKSSRYIVYLDDQLDLHVWWTRRLPSNAALTPSVTSSLSVPELPAADTEGLLFQY